MFSQCSAAERVGPWVGVVGPWVGGCDRAVGGCVGWVGYRAVGGWV